MDSKKAAKAISNFFGGPSDKKKKPEPSPSPESEESWIEKRRKKMQSGWSEDKKTD